MAIRVLLILAPPALLSAVSRQMQREASDVVYSARDTFFVPLGSIDDDGWWCIPRPFAQVKRLDIAFDMQNITENIAYTLQCVKYRQDKLDGTPGRTPFEELTNAERWDLLHEKNKEGFTFDIWPSTISACIGIDGLDLLRLDLTNWRYPVGCCRMGHTLLGYLDGNGYNYRHPKRIEIVGMLEREQHICRDMLAHSGKIPLDCVFFVDGQGCTCKEGASCDPKFQVLAQVLIEGIHKLSIDFHGIKLIPRWRSEIDRSEPRHCTLTAEIAATSWRTHTVS